jgi:hypothetical protein
MYDNTCPLVWFFQSKELQTEPLDIHLNTIVISLFVLYCNLALEELYIFFCEYYRYTYWKVFPVIAFICDTLLYVAKTY